jgi:diguanylate cyclase (GGDEF)-like protein
VCTLVADRLRRSVRDSDVAGRLGGDEFAVLVEDPTSMDGAERVASRILDTVRQPMAVRNQEVSISGSIGIVLTDAQAQETSEELLKQADEAMYAAKRSGKGLYERAPGAEPALA